jgi:hypothetical protein
VLAEPRVLKLDRRAITFLITPGEELGPLGPQLPGFFQRQREPGIDGPILVRDERPDLPLAFDHQPDRDGLDAACGQASCDFLPEQRRDLVADDAVEDAPGLLGVDAVLIDRCAAWRNAWAMSVLVIRGKDDALGLLAGMPSSCERCHAMASPSRSKSVANQTSLPEAATPSRHA